MMVQQGDYIISCIHIVCHFLSPSRLRGDILMYWCKLQRCEKITKNSHQRSKVNLRNVNRSSEKKKKGIFTVTAHKGHDPQQEHKGL